MRRKTDSLPENPPLFTGGLHLEFALYHHRAGPPRRRIAGGGLGDPAVGLNEYCMKFILKFAVPKKTVKFH